jgi:hypothetical protein
MRYIQFSFYFFIVLVSFLNDVSFASDEAGKSPFNINEKLVFDISYFGVSGGTAVLEVVGIEKVGDRDAYHVISTAKTNEFFSRFYTVLDIIQTYIDTENYYPLRMKINQHEGDHKKKSEIIFDQENNKAIELKKYNKKIVYDIVENVQDSLSSLFYIRLLELKVGEDVVFDAYASRRSWQLTIKVLKKERIKVEAGAFNTILVKPILKYNDVFVNKGDVYIWLSDDFRKIPVKMKSKVAIGAFTAELISQSYGIYKANN